jgi:predicted nucleic acid-binding protein
VLVDSHLWIEYFAGRSNAYCEEVNALLQRNLVCTAGPVLLEVLAGVEEEERRLYLHGRLRKLPYLESSRKVWEQAVLCGVQVAGSPRIVPYLDMLIAALCQVHDCALFTRDPHFDLFPKLRRHQPGR